VTLFLKKGEIRGKAVKEKELGNRGKGEGELPKEEGIGVQREIGRGCGKNKKPKVGKKEQKNRKVYIARKSEDDKQKRERGRKEKSCHKSNKSTRCGKEERKRAVTNQIKVRGAERKKGKELSQIK
jgi:hypothetical protein